MKKYRSMDLEAGELVRNLGRLTDLRSRSRLIDSDEIQLPLLQGYARALWSASEATDTDLPSILIGSESTLANLMPKLLALPGVVTPVTSLMKAWHFEDLEAITFDRQEPLSGTATAGYVGLMVGELTATIGPEAELRLIGSDGVRRTLTFACAKAAMAGWRQESLATIVQRWTEASALTGNSVDVAPLISIASLCGFVQSLSVLRSSQDATPLALAHWIQSWMDARGDLRQRDLLQRALPQYVATLASVGGREKRYDIVLRSLDEAASSGKALDPLELGFLFSLIEPGSFDFIELARRADSNGGTVAASYCLCAGILGNQATLSKFSGFGWVVLRQVLRPDIDFTSDISLAELRVLHNVRRDAPIPFRTRSPFLIDVEIAPMVTGTFANSTRRRPSPQASDDESGTADRDDALRERLLIALRALEEAYGVLERKRDKKDRKSSPQRRLTK